MRRFLLSLGLLTVTSAVFDSAAFAQQGDRYSFLGKAPPEIVSDKNHWIGACEPLTLSKLKGQVVWLHFNF